tara:strand:+ start:326 stop:622 length:297 start_codon:yes stop_codon:yes gene_type:complete
MKKLFATLLAGAALAGCSSNTEPPSMELNLHNRQVEMMERQEVIGAIDECRLANLRPIMIYSKIKVNNYITPIVINVTCVTSSAIEEARQNRIKWGTK